MSRLPITRLTWFISVWVPELMSWPWQTLFLFCRSMMLSLANVNTVFKRVCRCMDTSVSVPALIRSPMGTTVVSPRSVPHIIHMITDISNDSTTSLPSSTPSDNAKSNADSCIPNSNHYPFVCI